LTESYCLGFNMIDGLDYRGIKFEPLVVGNKAEEYDLIYRKYPEVAKWVKSCNDDSRQWCGKCYKCWRASVWGTIFGFSNIPKNVAGGIFISEEELAEMLSMLAWYRKSEDRQMEVEFKILSVIYNALDILSKRKGIYGNTKKC